MTFLSANILRERRERGLTLLGGPAPDSALDGVMCRAVPAESALIRRVDELLAAYLSHPSDLRICGALETLCSPGMRLNHAIAHAAAFYIASRQSGSTPDSIDGFEQQRLAYESLCFSAIKALHIRELS